MLICRRVLRNSSALSKIAKSSSSSAKNAQLQRIACFNTAAVNNRDKKLFTPGPLGINYDTKAAMLRDLGSRDSEFMDAVKHIRQELLNVASVDSSEWTVVPMQGSGTFAIEAAITSTVPRGGKMLVVYTGSYGKRVIEICNYLDIEVVESRAPEDEFINLADAERILREDKSITNVSVVHCETSSGVVHPIEELGKIVRQHATQASFFVDAMSSFGAVPVDFTDIDYLVSSVNKCIEGVPGFAYVICRRDKLAQCKGISRSLSLDIFEQNAGLEKSGQFRFTPPTHAIMAFKQALQCLAEEGGPTARAARYQANRAILRAGMKELGFKEFLTDKHEGYIITSFNFPKDKSFNFEQFYTKLNELDQVIYPGKVTNADSFRIGSIGDLHAEDMEHLLVCIKQVLESMQVQLPLDAVKMKAPIYDHA